MQIARTGYLAAYSLIPDATSKAWFRRRDILPPRMLLAPRVDILSVPWVSSRNRLTLAEVAPNFWRAEARFGFMERPHIPELLLASKVLGCTIDVDDVTYYVGRETVIPREDGLGLPAWQERIFAVMERNAVHVSDFFSLPNDQVVEIGRQVAI